MKDNIIEEFKKIPGFDDYEISANGIIYSFRTRNRKRIQVTKNTENSHYVKIRNNDGVAKKVYVEKLVHTLFGISITKRKNYDKPHNYNRKEVIIDGELYAFPPSVFKMYKVNSEQSVQESDTSKAT